MDAYKTLAAYTPLWLGDDFDISQGETIVVLDQDDTPIKTGLLDALGRPIIRIRERVRCGFVGSDSAE